MSFRRNFIFYLLWKKIEKKKKNKKRSDEIKVNFIEENITCCQKKRLEIVENLEGRRITIDGVEDETKRRERRDEDAKVCSIYGFRLPQTKHFSKGRVRVKVWLRAIRRRRKGSST